MRYTSRTTNVKLTGALAAAVLVAAAGAHSQATTAPLAGDAPTAGRQPVLAVLEQKLHPLARVDPVTLRPRDGTVPLAGLAVAWAFSPDGSQLALATWGARLGLRFVDLEHMRALGDVRLTRSGDPTLLAWPTPKRLLALVQPLGPRNERRTPELVSVDPQAHRLLAKTTLPGTVLQTARSREGLVVLLAPRDTITPVRVVVADAGSAPRSVTLERISGGAMPPAPDSGSYAGHHELPGLAVDRRAERAYVVGAGEPVAEIDLRTLAVTYHDLQQPVSAFGRMRQRLAPQTTAKAQAGHTRQALWLGNGLLGVSGSDESVSTTVDTRGNTVISEAIAPAGLKLIDTGNWSVRTIDPDATRFTPAGGLLLATAVLLPAGAVDATGIGLVGYDVTGRKRFHRFGTDFSIGMETAGSYAYVFRKERGQDHVLVLGLPGGRLVRDLRLELPTFVS